MLDERDVRSTKMQASARRLRRRGQQPPGGCVVAHLPPRICTPLDCSHRRCDRAYPSNAETVRMCTSH